jgi:hypothetical protein
LGSLKVSHSGIKKKRLDFNPSRIKNKTQRPKSRMLGRESHRQVERFLHADGKCEPKNARHFAFSRETRHLDFYVEI